MKATSTHAARGGDRKAGGERRRGPGGRIDAYDLAAGAIGHVQRAVGSDGAADQPASPVASTSATGSGESPGGAAFAAAGRSTAGTSAAV